MHMYEAFIILALASKIFQTFHQINWVTDFHQQALTRRRVVITQLIAKSNCSRHPTRKLLRRHTQWQTAACAESGNTKPAINIPRLSWLLENQEKIKKTSTKGKTL